MKKIFTSVLDFVIFMLIAVIMFLFIMVNKTHAQGWEKIYGSARSETAYDVKQTPDGGYIAVVFQEYREQILAEFILSRPMPTEHSNGIK